VLEYRDGARGQLFRADEWVTPEDVLATFLSYLAGTEEWRTGHTWSEFIL
jgi:hypothetical protein